MYTTIITPRVCETDGVGHINNTVLPVWFEAGRAELFRLFNPSDSFENWPMVVRTYAVTFDREMVYGPDVRVECEVARLGTSSVQLSERVVQNGEITARGNAVYVLVGRDRRPMPIPAEIRAELRRHLLQVSYD